MTEQNIEYYDFILAVDENECIDIPGTPCQIQVIRKSPERYSIGIMLVEGDNITARMTQHTPHHKFEQLLYLDVNQAVINEISFPEANVRLELAIHRDFGLMRKVELFHFVILPSTKGALRMLHKTDECPSTNVSNDIFISEGTIS